MLLIEICKLFCFQSSPLKLKNDFQIVQNIDTGKYRLLDPNGTMYGTDMNGYKKQKFLPKITGFQGYRFRVNQAIRDRDAPYLPRDIDLELERERSKFMLKNANLLLAQQRAIEEQRKLNI